MTKKQKKTLIRIIITAVLFAVLLVTDEILHLFDWIPANLSRLKMIIYLIPYVVIGYDIVAKAVRNISHGQVFDENFLMMVATFGAFGVEEYIEAVAVMLLYQVGELFQSYAIGKSRQSISDMMDIVPEYANIEVDGRLEEVDPDDVEIGSIIVIKPGEKVPLDGIIIEGESMLDTAALTGESVPRSAKVGDNIFSGCVNGSGILKVQTTKEFDDSTVSKILEMVENASEKKSHAENFITRFARVYTPIVTIAALILAVIPPVLTGLISGIWSGDVWYNWITTACTFLVISCPCALVISVPMGFFGGIGAASKIGVLVKGSNYLEYVSQIKTIVFDKTGTLTKGEFKVSELIASEALLQKIHTENEEISQTDVLQRASNLLLELAALGEAYSNHPIALSIREAYGQNVDMTKLANSEEIAGHGTKVTMADGAIVLAGNEKLMVREGIAYEACDHMGTIVYVAVNGTFAGTVVISDSIKEGVKDAIQSMKQVGVEQTVMLTGDREKVAHAVAEEIGIDTVRAELLPGDKVGEVEKLLEAAENKSRVAFVGDGINDAPVLKRADVGFAMGSMGSDAAIEAADVVIMDDDVRKIAGIVRIARKTIRIVKQNIVFSLGVKAIILVLGILNSIPNCPINIGFMMLLGIFADVGVCTLAILNSMRTLKTR